MLAWHGEILLYGGSCPRVLERGCGDTRISLWALSSGIHRSECVVGALVEKGMLQEPDAMVGKGREGGSILSGTCRVTGFAVCKGVSW